MVFLSGPCFSPAQVIECSFGGSVSRGYHFSERLGYCISPHFESAGWKNLRITVRESEGEMPTYTGSSRFYASKLVENLFGSMTRVCTCSVWQRANVVEAT